jgi:cytochrome P450
MMSADYKHIKPSSNPRFMSIPGGNGLPLFGQLFSLLYDLPRFVRSHHRQYGPVFRINAGPEKIVIVLGAEFAREVLMDKEQRFSTELGYQRLLPLFGRGVLQYDFDEHLFQRRIFQSAFRTQALRGYAKTVAVEMNRKIWQWRHVQNFRLFDHLKGLLLRSALAVFYGIHETEERNEKLAQAFVDAINGTVRIFDIDLPGFRMHRALRGRRIIREYIRALIPERRVAAGADLLSCICKEKKENGEYFSDHELIDHAGFLLLAAHDTNTSLIQHLIYYLTKYPEWQDRIRAEVGERSVLDIDYDDLQAMEALSWVIDETLRMHSSTPAVMRRTLKTVHFNGVVIPANSSLLLIPGFNHYDPADWTDPDKFDPERFSPTRGEHRKNPYSFIPFGAGVHKCIGMHFARMQVAIFVSHFLRLYRFRTPPGYRPKFQYMPLSKIRDGLPLILSPRQALS